MMSEFIEDDIFPGSQNPCETCGDNNFYSEAGFYYCLTCNTQSQSARVYVDEDFIPERQYVSLAGVLRDGRDKGSKKKGETNDVKIASTWEVWNFVLKYLADRLVELGFPEEIRNKILHLYSTFMIRRKVIFVSRSNPAAKSSVTLGEPKTNIWSLYDQRGISIRSVCKRKKKPLRFPKESHRHADKNLHGTFDPEELATRAQRKRKFAMTKRKAIEQEYLGGEEGQQMQEDAEFEKAISGQPVTSNERNRSNQTTKFNYTRAVRILKCKYLKSINIRKAIINPGPRPKRRKNYRKYLDAKRIVEYERFTPRTCLILVFVALRQLGLSIVFTDIIRLAQCGVFDFQTIQNKMKEYEGYKNMKFLFTHNYFHAWQRIKPTYNITRDIISFNHYLGIKRFYNPQMKEIVPKYVDDFVLPREFECVVNMFNHMYSFDELSWGSRIIRFKTFRFVPELVVMCQIVVILKMLFGLDDLTEKYQSEFAKLVNKVIKDEVKAQGCKMEDWTELFVIEDWFGYIQRRRDLVKRELSNHCMVLTPNQPHTLTKLNDLMKKSCSINDEDREPEELTENQINANDCIKTFKNILKDQLRSSVRKDRPSEIPTIKPYYVPLPLPTQSIVDQYLERYPNVGDASFKPELFKADFVKKRIDFIWNPRKYTELLELNGYNVKIVRGDAVNNFPKDLKEGTVVVFQPYRGFDEFIDGFRKGCSDSLQLLFGVCEDIVPSLSGEKNGSKHSFDNQFFPNVTQQLGEIYIEKVLRNCIPILTRWDEDKY